MLDGVGSVLQASRDPCSLKNDFTTLASPAAESTSMSKHYFTLLFALLLPAPVQLFSRELAAEETYQLVRVIEVAGRQGVAADEEHYYISGSQSLHKYSKQGKLLMSNEDPFAALEKRANHFGDISVHKGEIFAGIEWFEDGRGQDIQIAVYDAQTLKFKRSFPWNPDSGQVEVSALAVDARQGLVWMTDWVNGNFVYRYRLQDGSYAGKLHLRPVPQWQQGITCFNGSLYLTADDGDADRKEVDNLWKVPAEPTRNAAYVQHELAFDQFRDFGEIEGLDFDPETGELLVLANRGKRIVLGMPKGLYPGYDREISEVYVFRVNR